MGSLDLVTSSHEILGLKSGINLGPTPTVTTLSVASDLPLPGPGPAYWPTPGTCAVPLVVS